MPQDPMTGGDPNMMGGPDAMDGDPNMMPQDPMMGGDPNMMGGAPQGGESEFDSGFDPGVEADEDEDPKRFIQQLTGKLSQSLNTYEDKEDDGLYKYVGKMIVKQAAKNLDDKGRKDLIKAVNMADADTSDDDEMGSDLGGEEDMNPEMENGEMQQEPMMESVFKKSDFEKVLFEEIGAPQVQKDNKIRKGRKTKNIFNGPVNKC